MVVVVDSVVRLKSSMRASPPPTQEPKISAEVVEEPVVKLTLTLVQDEALMGLETVLVPLNLRAPIRA